MLFGSAGWQRILLPFLCAGLTAQISAQKIVSARAGLITYVQGPAYLDGKRLVLNAARFPQMKAGQILSTARSRAEMLLSPEVILRLAENADLRMDDDQLANTRVSLLGGEALIEIVQLPDGNRIQIQAGEATTELTRPGLYRFGIARNGTDPANLRVHGGEALVHAGEKTVQAKRGSSVRLDRGLALEKFDRKKTDALHAWAARRSFSLFLSDPDARRKQTHWQFSGGYAENKNFGVVFRVAVRGTMPAPAIRSVPPAEIGPETTPASGR